MKIDVKNLPSIVVAINILLASIVGIFISKIDSLYRKYDLKIQSLEILQKDIVSYTEKFEKQYNATVAIYIKDMSTQYEVKINSEKLIPAASIIKVPIMAAVYYLAEKGELSLDEFLVYKKKHRCGGAGIIKSYPYGTKFKIRELVELMITISDNIATHMLIERVGLKRFNEIFKTLELKNTTVNRYVMDLNSRRNGIENYTTAEDIGYLLEKIYKGSLISKRASAEMLWYLLQQKISDRLPKKLPPQTVVAHKTGLMRDLCHDAGIVYTHKGEFVICILVQSLYKRAAKNFIAEIAFKTYSVYNQTGDDNNRYESNTAYEHTDIISGSGTRNY
ncbi:MAG: class A beta-lactamase-related serine hydrolase [Endomicrobia bacterium]|nr:class A beta-lactamase-related serine hydrolase [Endomicrobiia bacterium]